MADANELVTAMKKAALDAMESTKPVNIFFGKVQEVNPLKINVEQKMVLGTAQLVLARNVTDYTVEVTVDCSTESDQETHSHTVSGIDSKGDAIHLTTDESTFSHDHKITGKKNIVLHNGLAVGDEVILIRQQGGQKFVVIDRIGGMSS